MGNCKDCRWWTEFTDCEGVGECSRIDGPDGGELMDIETALKDAFLMGFAITCDLYNGDYVDEELAPHDVDEELWNIFADDQTGVRAELEKSASFCRFRDKAVKIILARG